MIISRSKPQITERTESIADVLSRIARSYPEGMVEEQLRDIPRIAFNIGLAVERCVTNVTDSSIMDIGGGVGLFSVGCAAIGFKRVVLVDDFRDPVNLRLGDEVPAVHHARGVEVVSRDVVAHGLGTGWSDFDVITTFDSVEHWHHSPKDLFKEVMAALRPGGSLILGAPNCVNLRKRLTIPFGRGKWSSLQDWYESKPFRGHVREPDVDDLRYIARDLGLVDVCIRGRNWMGYSSSKTAIRIATHIVDQILHLRPSLCSDLYLLGRKQGITGKA